jgi:hypothetical protein
VYLQLVNEHSDRIELVVFVLPFHCEFRGCCEVKGNGLGGKDVAGPSSEERGDLTVGGPDTVKDG